MYTKNWINFKSFAEKDKTTHLVCNSFDRWATGSPKDSEQLNSQYHLQHIIDITGKRVFIYFWNMNEVLMADNTNHRRR